MGSEVTAADREKATRLWSERDIAQALAAERAKARAPFLAVLRWSDQGPADEAPSYREVVDRIRRAAEEPT